jgi:biotin carboxylase
MSEALWLVSVCAGRWQLKGIAAARAAGLKVLALDGDPDAPGLKAADLGSVADVRDPEAVLRAVRALGLRPSGAISFAAEAGMLSAAAVREAFGLPGPGMDLALSLTDKLRQRRAWTLAGVPGPRWEAARSIEEAASAASRIGFPLVVKPCDSAGSRGVSKVESGGELRAAASAAFDASRSKTVLVESHMAGTEFTVETFSERGRTHVLAVTSKTKVPGTGGTVANELATPDLPGPAVDAVAQAAVDALAALGYSDGPGHSEVIMGPDLKPGLVESAGRGGGFMVFDMLVPRLSGYDIATACALQAVGLEPPPVRLRSRAGVLRFFPSRPGTVRGWSGFEEAAAVEGVSAGPFVAEGEKVGSVHGDADRLGFIFTEASTPALARGLADRAESLIHFDVSPPDENESH